MKVFEKIYSIVESIPRGKVASYGQVAAIAGYPRGAQMVGWALHQMNHGTAKRVPWHRVVNARGEISTTCQEHSASLQAKLLKKEGVLVQYTPEGVAKVDMQKYAWVE